MDNIKIDEMSGWDTGDEYIQESYSKELSSSGISGIEKDDKQCNEQDNVDDAEEDDTEEYIKLISKFESFEKIWKNFPLLIDSIKSGKITQEDLYLSEKSKLLFDFAFQCAVDIDPIISDVLEYLNTNPNISNAITLSKRKIKTDSLNTMIIYKEFPIFSIEDLIYTIDRYLDWSYEKKWFIMVQLWDGDKIRVWDYLKSIIINTLTPLQLIIPFIKLDKKYLWEKYYSIPVNKTELSQEEKIQMTMIEICVWYRHSLSPPKGFDFSFNFGFRINDRLNKGPMFYSSIESESNLENGTSVKGYEKPPIEYDDEDNEDKDGKDDDKDIEKANLLRVKTLQQLSIKEFIITNLDSSNIYNIIFFPESIRDDFFKLFFRRRRLLSSMSKILICQNWKDYITENEVCRKIKNADFNLVYNSKVWDSLTIRGKLKLLPIYDIVIGKIDIEKLGASQEDEEENEIRQAIISARHKFILWSNFCEDSVCTVKKRHDRLGLDGSFEYLCNLILGLDKEEWALTLAGLSKCENLISTDEYLSLHCSLSQSASLISPEFKDAFEREYNKYRFSIYSYPFMREPFNLYKKYDVNIIYRD